MDTKFKKIPLPSNVTLTLSLLVDSWALTSVLMRRKFDRGYGAYTNSRLKLVTFNFDLELELVWFGFGCCTSGEHLTKFNKALSKGPRYMERTG